MRYRAPIVLSMVIIAIMILTGCSSNQSDKSTTRASETLTDTTSKDSVVQKDSRDSSKKLKKRKAQILESARQNRLFNAEKWLKSDYAFFKRPKPGRISEYDHIIKKMARRYGFDWRLIAAQIYTESNFRNAAKSHVGATGLMQIMPGTAKFMGYDPKLMIKPEVNIAVGCLYDQRMYSLWKRQTTDYNRLAFALASYNAGRGRVLRSYSTKDSITTWEKVHPNLPEETQSYVHKIYLKHEFYSKYLLP